LAVRSAAAVQRRLKEFDMRFLPIALLLVLGVAALPAAQCAETRTLPTTVRIGEVATGGIGKPTGAGLASIAKEKGFFDEEFAKDGVQLEVIYFPGAGTAVTESLASGNIDFGGSGGICNIIGLAGQVPARVVSVSHGMTSLYLAVRADSPLHRVEDLRNLKVVGQRGTNAHVLLVGILAAHGLSEGDVKEVNLQSAEALPALTAGLVDAIVGGAVLQQLSDQGRVRIIASSAEVADAEGTIGGMLVTNHFEATYPEATARVVKVLTKAAWWASLPEHRQELIEFQSRTGIPSRYYEADFSGDLKPRYSPLIDPAIRESYRKLIAFGIDHKLIRRASSLDSWFETKYLDQALHDLGLETFWTAREVAAVAPVGQ
jgi:sulfonate transport system substrate-binding protein